MENPFPRVRVVHRTHGEVSYEVVDLDDWLKQLTSGHVEAKIGAVRDLVINMLVKLVELKLLTVGDAIDITREYNVLDVNTPLPTE